jgi:hypothetical protein
MISNTEQNDSNWKHTWANDWIKMTELQMSEMSISGMSGEMALIAKVST